MIIFILSLLLGAAAGLLAGLFGIGGGVILVPALVLLFADQGFPSDQVMIMAVATSLATIIFTAIASIVAHHRLGAIQWQKVFRLAPGITIGALAGALIADRMSGHGLRLLFIGYLLYAAFQLAKQNIPRSGDKPSPRFLDPIVGLGIGALSALIGIGGGTLTVPYLVFFQTPIRNAVAISSACGLPIAVAGTLSYAILGERLPLLPAWSLGYIYLPAFLGVVATSVVTAPIGAKIAGIIPAQKLKRYFALLLVAVAARMLWL